MCKVFSLHVFRIQSFLWIADRNSPQGSLQIQCTALALPDVESISRESAVPVKSSFPAALSTGVFWCSNPGQQSPCQLIRLRRDPRTFQQSTGLLEPGGTLTARTCCSRPRLHQALLSHRRKHKKNALRFRKASFGAPSGTRTQDPLIKSQLLSLMARTKTVARKT